MDNLDKLIEAVEHPERFSEAELQTLLSDSETKQLYKLMCAARAEAFVSDTEQCDSEIDLQWKNFKASHRKKKPIFLWHLQRKAAAVIALSIASCSIIMVGVSLSKSKIGSTQGDTGKTTPTEIHVAEKGVGSPVALNDTVIVFEDEKLDFILDEIAPYYNVDVDLKSPTTKEIRLFLKWDSTTGLSELIEHLNSFDRINLFLKEDIITDY